MHAKGTPQEAICILREVIPDLDRRALAFTVLTGPAGDDIRHFFHEYVSGLLSELRAALDRADWPVLARHAHSLKGAGGGVGYPEISVLSECMERSAKAGDDRAVRLLVDALAAWQAAERGAL